MRHDMQDELGRLMRAADPARTRADVELSATQLALRDRIMHDAPSAATRSRLWWRGWRLATIPAAAMLVVAFVAIWSIVPLGHQTAAALTPQPLEYEPTSATLREVVSMAQELVSESAATEARRGSSAVGWYLDLDYATVGDEAALITPQETARVWNPDGSGEVTIRAGKPYWADGRDSVLPHGELLAPGTILSILPFDATQAPQLQPQGGSVSDMEDLLASFGLLPDAPAGDVINAIQTVMDWWTLTDQQHVSLLEILVEHGSARLLGTTTDRAGRSVFAIEGDSRVNPQVRNVLLVSADTGRIIGAESTRVVADESLPAGSVVSYTMWGLG